MVDDINAAMAEQVHACRALYSYSLSSITLFVTKLLSYNTIGIR